MLLCDSTFSGHNITYNPESFEFLSDMNGSDAICYFSGSIGKQTVTQRVCHLSNYKGMLLIN